jgi:hypothetical protein
MGQTAEFAAGSWIVRQAASHDFHPGTGLSTFAYADMEDPGRGCSTTKAAINERWSGSMRAQASAAFPARLPGSSPVP